MNFQRKESVYEQREKRKKLKTRVLSFIGILAGCLMIFAGYWIMQQMLEKRQNKLLSQTAV